MLHTGIRTSFNVITKLLSAATGRHTSMSEPWKGTSLSTKRSVVTNWTSRFRDCTVNIDKKKVCMNTFLVMIVRKKICNYFQTI